MLYRIQEIEELLKNSNVTTEAFASWKNHPVTKRFMLELEYDLLSAREDKTAAGRDSLEKIALECVKNAQIQETLEELIAWIPNELKKDEQPV